MRLPRPITEPGLSTLPQPTSTSSPSMAPNFLSPVSSFSPPQDTVTRVLSLLTLEVIDPAPIWERNPRIESPT